MTNEEAYNIISEFCFTGYEDNKKPSFKLFGAIHELILDVEENSKLKAENEEYKKETSQDKIDYAYDLGYQSCLNYNGVSWKDAEEIQKLRREIEELKSELEQSVREKSEVISKIEYALNECEPIYNKCAVIPQAKPIYDLAMNYCLDLMKGQVLNDEF